jgi:hypothetical protein
MWQTWKHILLERQLQKNNFYLIFKKLPQSVKHYLYIPHAIYQLPCLSQTDWEWAEFITELLSYECMWASNSSNTNTRETQTHVAVQMIYAWAPPLPLMVEHQANMSCTNRVHTDQFKQISGPSSVTPTSVARFLTQPYLLNNQWNNPVILRVSFNQHIK